MLDCRPNNFVLNPVEKVTSDPSYSYHFNAYINLSEVNLIWFQPLLTELDSRSRIGSFLEAVYFFI